MTPKDLLIQTLNTIQPCVKLQGTYQEGEAYPNTFITFWTVDVPELQHHDDDVSSWEWNFQVMNYSTNPETVEAQAEKIRTELKAAGFIPQGKGHDLLSDEPTHTGWAQDFKFIEYRIN